ncbi:MAG: AAA family ATPase [Patescibacteria group bacterium]
MKKLVIGIGIPGSGKTTFLTQYAKSHGYAYISPDDIREELTGDRLHQARNAEVWQLAEARMRDRFQEGESVVFDATFVRGYERRSFIEAARAYGAECIEGYYFDVPLEIAQKRNIGRENPVRHHALARMDRLIREDPPRASEGLNSVFVVNEEGVIRN